MHHCPQCKGIKVYIVLLDEINGTKLMRKDREGVECIGCGWIGKFDRLTFCAEEDSLEATQ